MTKRLDEKYIPLAKSIANAVGRKYKYHDQEDLESVAMLALVEAVQSATSDHEGGVVEYLKSHIRGTLLNYLNRDVYNEVSQDEFGGAWFMETTEDSYEDKLIAEEAAQEREDMLHDAIKQLTPQQQRVVKLLHFEGKTQEEAAAILGLDRTSITKLNQRVMNKLRGILDA